MRRLAAIALFAFCAVIVPAAGLRAVAAETRFLAGTEDVPLMPGLHNDESTLVVFDKPQGRIVEIVARGRVKRAAVERFYDASLPPLGWVADGKLAWRREDEGLRLDIKGRDGDLRVGFTLAPR